MEVNNQWLSWAVELQSLAQAGLTYGKMFMTGNGMNGSGRSRLR